jgi:cholesterol transport system auxiliary component
MVYSQRAHEISYYAVNRWADTPARMLLAPLTRALERSDLWVSVVQTPTVARPDHRLDSDNLAIEQQFSSNSSRVRLALRVQLIDLERQSVLGTRHFEFFEPAPSDDAYGGVKAANRAATRMLEELNAWVESVMKLKGER